jgi:3-oxoacyl-[acyl-carrier-protein] synthase-1
LRAADEILARQTSLDRVLILAVDSLLDTLTLEWLAAGHRLKSPSTPMGLMPGEAAAAMIVERQGSTARAGGLGVAVRTAAETAPQGERELTGAVRGERLATVLAECLANLAAPAGDGCMLISDQNGEQWRAEELAYCNLRLTEVWPVNASVLLPAVSLGDTGAASGAVNCCLGALALRSGMARVRQSVVVGSSAQGRAGAALLSVA